MKGKRILLPAVILAIGLSLTGCQQIIEHSGASLVDIQSGSDQTVEGTCVKMNAKKSKEIVLSEGETPEIRFDLSIDEGNLELLLTDKDGVELLNDTLDESKNFTVALEQPGSYHLSYTGKMFSGKYTIGWGNPPAESSNEGADS